MTIELKCRGCHNNTFRLHADTKEVRDDEIIMVPKITCAECGEELKNHA